VTALSGYEKLVHWANQLAAEFKRCKRLPSAPVSVSNLEGSAGVLSASFFSAFCICPSQFARARSLIFEKFLQNSASET
jgi:hypothetical protein